MKKKPLEKTEASVVVHPLIRDEQKLNVVEELYEKDKAPEMKAVGFMNADPSRRNQFVSYVVTFKGDKVLKLEVSEPNVKGIAEESAKIDFVSNFIDVEF